MRASLASSLPNVVSRSEVRLEALVRQVFPLDGWKMSSRKTRQKFPERKFILAGKSLPSLKFFGNSVIFIASLLFFVAADLDADEKNFLLVSC